MNTKAKQVAKSTAATPSTTVANITDKALAERLAQDAGSGFEEATRDSFALPFVMILQDLSPQVKPKMAGYVKGAERE